MKKILDYNVTKQKLEQVKVMKAFEFRKLNHNREDKCGSGFAVAYKSKDGDTYIVSIEDRFVEGDLTLEGDEAQYICDTIGAYPDNVAITFGHTKIKEVKCDTKIDKLIEAYNIYQQMVWTDTKFENWEGMNKTEFASYKKENKKKQA